MNGGYCIISNVRDVLTTLPFEISPTIRLEKANDAQIAHIQSLLTQMSPGFMSPRGYYEHEWIEESEGDGSSVATPSPLERTNWRYYIVAFAGSGNIASSFFRAANLARPALSAFAEVAHP